jgi:hypothetical protein
MRTSFLLLPLLLAGCGGRAIDAPSLSPRAVERSPVPYPDEPKEPQVEADPALLQTLAAIEAEAAKGHMAFEAARARTTAAVTAAAGAAVASEAWTAAQQELSALDALRNAVGHAAVEIDALRGDPANLTSGNRGAIEAATARVGLLSQAESDAVAQLSRRLKA